MPRTAKMSSLFRISLLLASLVACSQAQAVPLPTIPAPTLLSGFDVEWAQSAESPHSIADAINILNGTGGFTIVDTHTERLSYIDLNDAQVPFAGADPVFAIRVSGYIDLGVDDSYRFFSIHDDGVRVSVGGETVINYPVDTATREDDSPFYSLAAGVYRYEAISWEQGGAFVFQLGFDDASGRHLLQGNHAPEPATLSLICLGLVGLGFRRKAA
jgi:hypothetical protein